MYEQITSNKRKSLALFFGFMLIYAAIAGAMELYAGTGGAIGVMVIAVVMIGVALWGGDDMAVRIAGGRRVEKKEQAPELWRVVENLSIAAGVPMPRVYISPDPSPNAFAAGRTPEQAVVCVHQGLLNLLDDAELEGVIAHEMTHVRNYDVRLMTYATVLAGSIGFLAQLLAEALRWGVVMSGSDDDEDSAGNILGIVALLLVVILAPIAAVIIQLAISRKREFVADAGAVELTRYPQGLASALQAISGDKTPPLRDERSISHMMIAPQLNVSGNASKLFSTHPPTEERVAKLMEMAGGVQHRRRAPVSQQFQEQAAADAAAAGQQSGSPEPSVPSHATDPLSVPGIGTGAIGGAGAAAVIIGQAVLQGQAASQGSAPAPAPSDAPAAEPPPASDAPPAAGPERDGPSVPPPPAG